MILNLTLIINYTRLFSLQLFRYHKGRNHEYKRNHKLHRISLQRPGKNKELLHAGFRLGISGFRPRIFRLYQSRHRWRHHKANLKSDSGNGSALIVFYSNNLQATLDKIQKAGGLINKAIFSFPGGAPVSFY